MTNSLDRMKDLKDDYAKIKIGRGKTMLATKRGTCEGMVVSKDDKKTEGIDQQLQQVVTMEESWFCC